MYQVILIGPAYLPLLGILAGATGLVLHTLGYPRGACWFYAASTISWILFILLNPLA
jgi:hypothetical protein